MSSEEKPWEGQPMSPTAQGVYVDSPNCSVVMDQPCPGRVTMTVNDGSEDSATIERIAAEATERWFGDDYESIPDLVRRAVRAGYEAGRRDAASTVMELATAAWRAAEEAAEVGGEEGVALAAEARAMALGDAAKALGALVASKEADRG